MNKTITIASLAAIVLFAGCARTEEVVTPADNRYPVDFGAYNGHTTTKAGPTDDINLEALKTHGFGVFATYTGTQDFTVFSGATDDFMYNQLVDYDNTPAKWKYTPLKYWPNPTNGQTADDQKVSFFAYAPYADPEATSADVTYGITGFSRTAVGTPAVNHNMVNYTFHPTRPNVDLLWGYKTKTIDPSTTPATVTYTVNENLTRTASTVHFVFKHLLSKLGGSQEGDPTSVGANGLIIKATPTAGPLSPGYVSGTPGDFGASDGTKITVSEIILRSAPEEDPVGTPVKDANNNDIVYATAGQTGTLDLYTGQFTLDAAAQPVQFYQKIVADMTSAPAGTSELADNLKEVPGVATFAAVNTGVLKEAQNVYKDEANPLILLPGTAPVVDVTITYVVRTCDPKLPKGFSEVPQTVWGRVKFPTIEANKKYNLCIILGLNHVEFSATVEDWEAGGVTTNIWLPSNL